MRGNGWAASVALALCAFTINAEAQNFVAPATTASRSGYLVSAPSAPTTSPTEFRQPMYVGAYSADGKFRAVNAPQNASTMLLLDSADDDAMQQQVPPSMRRRSSEAAVENLSPPAHATQAIRTRTLAGTLRDKLIGFAYGQERVLRNPTHVATDSRQRLIIADPGLASVHVLDTSGQTSFKIVGGPQHRLRSPKGVAVDGEDNIYVADGELGLIAVFDPAGRFLRYIGMVKDESMFDSPAGIAIDANSRRLYVLDPAGDELVVFDLSGNVLKRVGGPHTRNKVRLQHPTEIAIRNGNVVILDRYASRIQILDLECSPLRSFDVRREDAPPIVEEIGLAVDDSINIYVGNLLSSTVRIYRGDGNFLGYLGPNESPEIFNVPVGLWVDSEDRLFVSTEANGQVQVFQIARNKDLVASSQ